MKNYIYVNIKKLFTNYRILVAKKKHINYKIFNIILVGALAINIFYIYIKDYMYITVFLNYLEEYVKTYDVVIEDSKGYIDIYYVTENNKFKKLKSYPIELMVIYDISHYDNKLILLQELIKNQFQYCRIELRPDTCNMWSPSYKDIKGDFLRGETFGGIYRGVSFKFIYFIQDTYGYNLEYLDKLWPVLNRIIMTKKYIKGELITGLSLELNTLKIRKGTITDMSDKGDILINHYNDNFKWKPSVFLTYENRTRFQLIVIDLPINNFYIDVFFKYSRNKSNINLDYLKKIYKIEWITQRVLLMKEWWAKYK